MTVQHDRPYESWSVASEVGKERRRRECCGGRAGGTSHFLFHSSVHTLMTTVSKPRERSSGVSGQCGLAVPMTPPPYTVHMGFTVLRHMVVLKISVSISCHSG